MLLVSICKEEMPAVAHDGFDIQLVYDTYPPLPLHWYGLWRSVSAVLQSEVQE